jgi:hypothetical protein
MMDETSIRVGQDRVNGMGSIRWLVLGLVIRVMGGVSGFQCHGMEPGHLVTLASLGHEILGRDGCLELAGTQGSFARGGNRDIYQHSIQLGQSWTGLR